MREIFKDKEHLVRVAVLAVGGVMLFLLIKALLVPADFGVYGHFRAGALDDNRNRPLAFAGRQACADCHEDIVKARQASKHAGIGCETCHGPLAKHAADPAALEPERPDKRNLCLGCHHENVARPARFPQVNPNDHGDAGPCTSCHQAHHPEVEEPAAAGAATDAGASAGKASDPHAAAPAQPAQEVKR
jgi:predicted CXXCH cytochrome family protein